MKLSNRLKAIFWDVSPKDIDLKNHKKYFITRIAEKGRLKDILWLKKKFGINTIRRSLAGSRNISAKTRNFWRVI